MKSDLLPPEENNALFRPNDKGEGFIELALVLVLVAIVLIVILALLGPELASFIEGFFDN